MEKRTPSSAERRTEQSRELLLDEYLWALPSLKEYPDVPELRELWRAQERCVAKLEYRVGATADELENEQALAHTDREREERLQSYQDAMSVPCRKCGAGATQKCRTKNGVVILDSYSMHKVRFQDSGGRG